MNLSVEIEEAYKNVFRAQIALKHATERLILELPDAVADEIHYNGNKAKVDPAYSKVVNLLTGQD